MALAGAIWCAGLIILLIAGGPRPSLALALIPVAVLFALTAPLATLHQMHFRHRGDLEYAEFRRAKWLGAVPMGLRLGLFAGIAAFWIVALVNIAGSGNATAEVRNGQYVRMDRGGTTTVISKAEFAQRFLHTDQVLLAFAGFVETATSASLLGMDAVDSELQRRAADHKMRVAQLGAGNSDAVAGQGHSVRQRIAEREGLPSIQPHHADGTMPLKARESGTS